jgi:methylmalonyl-CoA carboxyltransferase large subunit
MTAETVDLARLADTLEGLRKEVAHLNERVAALEAGAANRAAPAPAPQTAPVAEGLSEEIVLVIGAAIAAFLGKKAHIRQIRLLDSPGWAQQGRATIQASHRLSRAP